MQEIFTLIKVLNQGVNRFENMGNRYQSIFVTGASGLLGSAALVNSRSFSKVFGAYLKHPIQWPGRPTWKVDFTDRRATEELLNSVSPEVIFHAAALVDIDRCQREPGLAHAMNVESTRILAEYSQKAGAKLVFISTDAFFTQGESPHGEDASPTPINVYGETKLEAEKVVQGICENSLIIRTNLYGWNYQAKHSLAEWMLYRLCTSERVPLVYDVFYSPILTQVAVECIEALVQKDAQGIFHVASDERMSKQDFGLLLCQEFGLDPTRIHPSSVKDIPLAAPRAKNMALSVKKLKNELPSMSLNVKNHLARFHELERSGYVSRLKGHEFNFKGPPS